LRCLSPGGSTSRLKTRTIPSGGRPWAAPAWNPDKRPDWATRRQKVKANRRLLHRRPPESQPPSDDGMGPTPQHPRDQQQRAVPLFSGPLMLRPHFAVGPAGASPGAPRWFQSQKAGGSHALPGKASSLVSHGDTANSPFSATLPGFPHLGTGCHPAAV
jgi:hypothetical protein